MLNDQFPVIAGLILLFLLSIYYYKRYHFSYLIILVVVASFFSKVEWKYLDMTLRFERIIAIIVFIYLIFSREKNENLNIYGILWILIVIFAFISSYQSDYFSISLKKTFGVAVYIPIFLLIRNKIKSRDYYREIISLYQNVGIAVINFSLLGYLIYFAGIDIGVTRYDLNAYWLEGPIAIANIFGFVSSIIFLITFHNIINHHNSFEQKIILLNSAIAILLSYTRSAWLGTGVGIFLILLLNIKKSLNIKLFTSIVLLFIAFSFIFIYTDLLRLFSYKISNLTAISDSGRGRFFVYEFILNDLKSGLILGRGTDYSTILWGENFYISSIFLVVLYDWGKIAFVLLLLFFFIVFYKNFQKISNNKYNEYYKLNFVLFTVILIYNQISTMHQLSIFWLHIGILSSMYIIKKIPDEENSDKFEEDTDSVETIIYPAKI